MSEKKLKPCPCGKTPDKLFITDNGAKWAYATGDCCNEWDIEFRTGHKSIESEKCMELAVEAWNNAGRDTTAATLRAERDEAVKMLRGTTSLARLKYGNLDKDIDEYLTGVEAFLTKVKP